jgi:nucleoporin NDC1
MDTRDRLRSTRLGRVRPRPPRPQATIQSIMSIGSTTRPPTQLSPPSRAITSTLSARAAPSVPPATQTYEPLARAVLRRRLLYDILPLSILPVWAATIFWKTWSVGGMSALTFLKALIVPFLPSTLLVTIFVWAFGVLPIVVLRKSQLTGEPVKL